MTLETVATWIVSIAKERKELRLHFTCLSDGARWYKTVLQGVPELVNERRSEVVYFSELLEAINGWK